MKLEQGDPTQLGSTPSADGVNFALYSAHAHGVELCLFDEDGARELQRYELTERTDDVWHGFLPGARAGQCYGYRVHGPFAPEAGHRFNAHKLLIDPYTRQLRGEIRHEAWIYNVQHPDIDDVDTAPFVPRCEVVERFPAATAVRPTPWAESAIYELHVRGFTKNHPAVPEADRGKLAGLCADDVLKYLKALGITAIELLPIQQFVSEAHLLNKGLSNYWGYNTLAWFCPHDGYVGRNGPLETRQAIERIHDAGLEVILDTVYNHSCEGSELGPTLSLRGIDNASYYRLQQENPASYVNDTGCGNTINGDHPAVRRLIIDNLCFWKSEMGIDGFRFDLATTLARSRFGFDPHAALLTQISNHPQLKDCKLIAEPWDIGPGGYRLGGFPTGWCEWNDRFRDSTRRFWRGDAGEAPEFARRLHGSADLFDNGERPASSSINFITSHDGFTLEDLVSYSQRHNLANGEDNRDGHSENYSDNFGVEGPSDDAAVVSRRQQRKRNLLATLMLAQGTPMLVAGDELSRTQLGNNNAYCQDNASNWIDWNAASDTLDGFIGGVLTLCRREPLLRAVHFRHRSANDDGQYVQWLSHDGEELAAEQWETPGLGVFACLTVCNKSKRGLLIAFNRTASDTQFVLPPAGAWYLRMDTARVPSIVSGMPVAERINVRGESIVLADCTDFVAAAGESQI